MQTNDFGETELFEIEMFNHDWCLIELLALNSNTWKINCVQINDL